MGRPPSAAGDGVRSSRRRFLAAVGVGLGAGVAGCVSAPRGDGVDRFEATTTEAVTTFPGDEVTMFRRGLRRRGYYGDETVPESVTVDWERAVNADPHTAAKATPLPTPEGPVLIPGDTGVLHAVAPDGEELWTYDTGATPRGMHGTPAVADGTAYVGAYDGVLYAVDVATGELEWRTDLGDAIGSSPAYHDGTVFVAVEFHDPDGSVFAVDAETGEVLWVGGRPTDHPHSTAAIDPEAGRLVVGSNDGNLYAWKYPSLEPAWWFETGDAIKGPIALHDGAAFFGSWDDRCYRVALDDGVEEWSFRTDASVMSAPAIDPEAGVVYVGSHDDHVYALDAASGEREWSANVGGWVIGGLTVAAGTVLAGSYDGNLYALDAETGRRRWRVENRGRVTSAPVVRDGRIYYAERAVVDESGDETTVETPGNAYCLRADR